MLRFVKIARIMNKNLKLGTMIENKELNNTEYGLTKKSKMVAIFSRRPPYTQITKMIHRLNICKYKSTTLITEIWSRIIRWLKNDMVPMKKFPRWRSVFKVPTIYTNNNYHNKTLRVDSYNWKRKKVIKKTQH